MEVVTTSNLVSSETEKTTTACNLQHDYGMRDQIGGGGGESPKKGGLDIL